MLVLEKIVMFEKLQKLFSILVVVIEGLHDCIVEMLQ